MLFLISLSFSISSYTMLSHPILCYLILSYLILSYLILSYRILSYRIISYRILISLLHSPYGPASHPSSPQYSAQLDTVSMHQIPMPNTKLFFISFFQSFTPRILSTILSVTMKLSSPLHSSHLISFTSSPRLSPHVSTLFTSLTYSSSLQPIPFPPFPSLSPSTCFLVYALASIRRLE